MTPDELAAIKERWEKKVWSYGENSSVGYVGDAWVTEYVPSGENTVLIDLDEPNATEVAFLRAAAVAPDDVMQLLIALAEAEQQQAIVAEALDRLVGTIAGYLDDVFQSPSVLAQAIGRQVQPRPAPKPPAFLAALRGRRGRTT